MAATLPCSNEIFLDRVLNLVFILIASRIPPGLLSALGLTILFCVDMDMNIGMQIRMGTDIGIGKDTHMDMGRVMGMIGWLWTWSST